ncbi:MAG: toll/interleukin-1 receptor domain-containing protein [Candidatus Methanoperedens sp.]|nr:toll/interleukin-1 receptor domain-containing protein [Candidatus Methanoperedens sp.]
MAHEKEVFICYETKTGLSYAQHLKKSLEKMKKPSFVAREDLKAGEQEKTVRESAIKECRYFVIIVTILALESEAVKKEIKLARTYNNSIIIPCKKNDINRDLLSKLPIVGELQQIEFETKEELAEKVISEILKIEELSRKSESISATEYLRREENCDKRILTKEMDNFNKYVTVESENVYGRVVMLHPFYKGNQSEEEDMILIRANDNEIRLTLKDANNTDIPNETTIRFFNEDKYTGKREPVGDFFYTNLKSKITIQKEVCIPINRALSIYVPNYAGKKIQAEDIMFRVDLCPGKVKV